MSDIEINDVVESLLGREVDYGLDETIGSLVMERVDRLFDEIQKNPL